MTSSKTALRCLAAALLCAATAAHASDRPYLATNSAAAEEDDDNVWAIESWLERVRHGDALHATVEYAFDPTTSLQLEWVRTRALGLGKVQDIELEFKHLFNHIARDGWGWGLSATISASRSESHWQRSAWTLTLPLSMRIGDESLLHLNAGVAKPVDERIKHTAAIAAERVVWRRTTLFGELARDADGTLAHVGVRYWVKKDRVSIDFALMQRRSEGRRVNGVVFGVGFNDL